MSVLWNLLARVVSRPAVSGWLIRRAMRTPYSHLPSNDDPSYMRRYWLFNPYGRCRWGEGLPSVRIHHIVRRDYDRHMHDHPWDARTIILKGGYTEERLIRQSVTGLVATLKRSPGNTAPLRFNEYHNITEVSDGGAWTLFITFKYRGTWGFLVDGRKVPWRKYLGLENA